MNKPLIMLLLWQFTTYFLYKSTPAKIISIVLMGATVILLILSSRIKTDDTENHN